jgi:Family of unknown function (DUF6099)
MDAQRLIKSTRHALTEVRSVPPALIEAWQACTLVEAVAATAAVGLTERALLEGSSCGAVEIASALAEAAGHAAACVGRPPDDSGGPSRAERLSTVRDVEATVSELRTLIHETAEALIVLACGAAEQELYWRCVDSVDAVAECEELATELLRAVRAGRPDPGPAPGSDPGSDPGLEPGSDPGPGREPRPAFETPWRQPADHGDES